MTTDYIGIVERKLRKRTNPWFAGMRRKHLKRTDFSIISNNCWAGTVYRYFGLPYLSPTAGLYFFADDYVKFAGDLKRYTNVPLRFIDASESMHAETLKARNKLNKPVARLDDIEVVFLHYPTPQEAERKWRRRCERINWNNVFIKFSEMNECTEQNLFEFDDIPFANKICFTARPMSQLGSANYFPGFEHSEAGILNDTDRFRQGFDLTAWLNREPVVYELGRDGEIA